MLLTSVPAWAATLVVSADEVNFRKSPNGEVICRLREGAQVEQLAKAAGGWIKIKATGACQGTGYVSAKLLRATGGAVKENKKPTKQATEAGLGKVPLIVTDKYNPQKEAGRGLTEITSALGLLTFGNIYKATALDMEKMLKEKLAMPELRPYFPNESERNKIAKRLAETVEQEHLRGGLTNEKIIAATRYAAGEILNLVVHRAMAKEGVTNAERRGAWAKKILAPFRACMDKSRTYHEGNNCLEATQEDAVKNIGLAISYEMIRQEIGPGYTNGISQPYQKCLKLGKTGANERVRGCVLSVVKAAAADFGIDKVKEAASADAPASADAIGKTVRPAFEKCLEKANGKEGFSRCADQLVGRAGGEIAAAAVMANEHVKKYFSSEKERRALADSAKAQFLECVEKNRASGKRDSSGNLQTENCARQVRLETARSVVHGLVASNLAKMEDIKPEARKQIQASVGKKIDGCWDSKGSDEKNNACMKNGIEELVGSVAEIKLGNRIPAALNAQEPKLKERLVQSVRACIREKLPKDVMHSSDAAAKVDGCAGELTREAALKVAAFELRQAIHGKTSDATAPDRLVKKLVGQDLAACLGPSPTDSLLAKCSATLKKAAAYSIGELLFGEEFDRFLAKNGGASAMQITVNDKKSFLAKNLASHRQCLDKLNEADTDAGVDACFKESVKILAGHLGQLAFRKSSREHVSDASELNQLAGDFSEDLASCLQEKADPKYSLNDYISNIDGCGNRLASSYTLELGSRQVAKALEANLSDPALAGRRGEIQKSLIDRFSGCLQASKAESERDGCVSSLKRDATKEITLVAAREQAKKLLNGGKIPMEFDEAEKELQKCFSEGTNPDLCARRHAQNVAKILGGLKLKVTLASSLGEETYKKSGRTIASLEADFVACVNSLPGDKADSAFMKSLKECGEKMEAKGVAFAQSSLHDLLSSPEAGSLESDLRKQAADAIPCLGPILPGGPVNEEALQAIRPEGILEAVAKAVGDYINYDAAKADLHFEKILSQVITDLEAAGPEEARARLLDLLVKEGMVDQLLKSMVRSQVKKSLDALPEDDLLGAEVTDLLLDRKVIENALTPELMAKLRPFMAEKLLRPILIEGKTLRDPSTKEALKQVEKEVAQALLASPNFGDHLVTGTVQKQIYANTGPLVRWFARSQLGYSFEWAEIRGSDRGKAAEAYVRDQVISPMVLGEKIPAEEMARRRAEASRLVTEAVSSFEK